MAIAKNPVKLIVFGANRGVGRCVVEKALADGHTVTAAVRSPEAMALSHPRLTVARCDAVNAEQVDAATPGHEAVFVTLGDSSRGPTTLYSEAAKAVTAAMSRHNVRRLMFLSNFGVLGERSREMKQGLLLLAVKKMIRSTLDDHRRALAVLQASQLDWTAVRAMPLSDAPPTGRYRSVAVDLPPRGDRITRADLAAFMISEATRCEFLRMTPAIAN
jgi:putative NADH-flavin reductase